MNYSRNFTKNLLLNRNWLYLILPIKLLIGVLIALYFWRLDSLASIRRIPMFLIFAGLLYIALQMISRRLNIVGQWWDWLYYFGLLSIMIPVTFADQEHLKLWNLITDIGTTLLIIPAGIDMFKLIVKWEKKRP